VKRAITIVLAILLIILSIPENNFFFRTAKADTFGRTEPGPKDYEAGSDTLYMSKFTMLDSDMKAKSMSIYIVKCGGGEKIKLYIYDCNDRGEPKDPIAETDAHELDSMTNEWITLDLTSNPTLSANTDYWLGFIVDKGIVVSFDDSQGSSCYGEHRFTDPLPSNPRVSSMTGEFAIYCTVESAGPNVSNPQPYDGAKWVRLKPKLSIQVNSTEFPINITWYTNASGSWQVIGTNTSITSNGTYSQIADEFNETDTTYWWKVNVSHNSSYYTEKIYSLKTAPDKIIIHIYFAGAENVGGGTAWFDANYSVTVPSDAPPEDDDYKNLYVGTDKENGRYINRSHQLNNFIVVKVKVYNPYNITSAYLHLKNLDTGEWDNSTAFTIDHSNWKYVFLECNKTVNQRGNYTFEVYVQNENGSEKTVKWYKKNETFQKVIRVVELNCTATDDIDYRIMYYRKYPFTYSTSGDRKDTLPHDGGPDGTTHDTGRLVSELPGDAGEKLWCVAYIGYWFEDEVCIEPTQIENVYFHDWWRTDDNVWKNGIGFSKRELTYADVEYYYSATDSDAVSNVSNYHLTTCKLTFTNPIEVDTNSIYNIFIGTPELDEPTLFTNRSILSFVIFNIPDNNTLQNMDSDGDGLNDYQELFETYTNPFLVDTDNDGDPDYHEYSSGTDPNNYTDETSNNAPYAYDPIPANNEENVELQPVCSVKVHDDESSTVTVKFYENTTGSWVLRQTNESVPVDTRVYWHYTQASECNTTYWWKVEVIDDATTSTFIYKFTTRPNLPPELLNPSVEPSSGVADYTIFYFNVTWKDADGDTPADGYLKVNISKTGWYLNASLSYISGDNTTGALYSYSCKLSAGEYNYQFWAYDGINYNHTSQYSGPSVEAQDLSFTIYTSSGGNYINFTAQVTPGQGLTTCYNVSAEGQDDTTPALKVENTGNVPLNFTWRLTADLPSGITLKYNYSNNPPNPGENLITTSEYQFATSVPVGGSNSTWMWMDFVEVYGGSGERTLQVNSTLG